MIDLSIIIVNWNVRDLLADCLASIAAAPAIRIAPDGTETGSHGPRCEVIVVDSASEDGSAQMVRGRFPWVRLLAETDNIGFVRGNNHALELAEGRHLLLLNPDTVIHGDALGQMVRFLDKHPDVGIVGPHVLNADGSTQSTRRRLPTRLTAFFESTWLQPHAPRRVLDHYYVTDQPDDGTFEVDWVQGCALLARREVYENIGALDTRYVMFAEELDWCHRARLAGWRVFYLGDAFITHLGGQSTSQVPAQKHIYFQQSKVRYFARFHGRAFGLALWVFLLLSYTSQVGIEAGKALLGSQPALRKTRIATYLRVIRALAIHPPLERESCA